MKKRKLEELSVDEFLAGGLSVSDTSDNEATTNTKSASKKAKLKSTKKSSKNQMESIKKTEKQKKKKKVFEKKDDSKKSSAKNESKTHKASLEKLKEKDPEFYQFLQDEDQRLLNFEASGSESDFDQDGASSDSGEENLMEEQSDDGDLKNEKSKKSKIKTKKSGNSDDDFMSDSEDSDDEGGFHKLPEKLEVATDSEEEEEDEPTTVSLKKDVRETVTIKMVNEWSRALQETSPKALKQVVQVFRAAVQRAGSEVVQRSSYRVEGGSVFNAVVRMCIRELPAMLSRYIKLPKPKDPNRPVLPLHSPQWRPIRKDMFSYLTDLIELVSQLAEADVLNVVLKHVTQMIPYYACNPKLNKALLRKLISLWSVGDETSRVLAFLSIIRLTKLRQDTFLEFVLKQMYLAYVKNCKFTSPTTLPLINFMQHSLVEIFALDHQLTYQYAFVYIRQLAIHLRNAITVKKKDTCHSVYNWQYMHSLHLWARTLSELHPSDVLQPLIYPLVQTIIGTIKLIPTSRYYPLRFHCVRALNMLSKATHTFIPTLPFLVEVFDLTDFSKKPKSANIKPFNFACTLKLSKTQLHEKSFRDGVIDQLYEHLMESFHIHSHTIGFPEMTLPPVIQMKKFVKTCKISNYTKQIKQILDKVDETSKVITRRRQAASLSLSDIKAVELWERKSAEEGTPLGKYYLTWRKLRDRELQHEVSGKNRISSDDLPVIERRTVPKERRPVSDTGLFGSSDDEDEDDTERFLPKNERSKKKQKTSKEDESDDYSDFDEADLERLAESASEGEDDDVDNDGSNGDMDDDSDDDSDDDEEDMDEDISDKEDVVEDFHFSSDED